MIIINNAEKFFKQLGLQDRVCKVSGSTASAVEAAQSINVELGMIAKSLTFKTDSRPILIVMSGDAKIHSSKFRKTFKVKSKMLEADEVLKYTGYEIGGVCPFNLASDEIDVYLDVSLKRYNQLAPGCGAYDMLVNLSLEELEKYSNYVDWVDIGKGWQE